MARFVSEEQKRAMKRGRELSSTVDAYLRAVGRSTPRGRKVTVVEMERRRLAALAEADGAVGVARLKLLQAATDLEDRIVEANAVKAVDIGALEAAFIEVAAEYSAAQSIGYSTWREAGVSAQVLKRVGIGQTRRRN